MSTLKKTSERRSLRFVLATLALAAAGTFVVTAQAAGPMGMGPDGGGPGRMSMRGGPDGGHGGPGMGMMGGRGIERMLDTVSATEAQRTQIRAILQAARKDMQAQHAAGQALREKDRAAWTKPNVDANEVEALRKQKLAQHEAASVRMQQARLEISRVLSPEQRKLLADKMAQRQTMMQRHRAERATLEGGK
jgi:Spy/CpxP family protein refolding chaperone